MYVLPMEKHELELVASICTMFSDVLLQENTRHTRTLPLLGDLEASCETDLRDLGPLTKAITLTQGCALGERARSQCMPKYWQSCAIGASPRNRVTPLFGVLRSVGAIQVECRHH
jgi:hypothetical protein